MTPRDKWGGWCFHPNWVGPKRTLGHPSWNGTHSPDQAPKGSSWCVTSAASTSHQSHFHTLFNSILFHSSLTLLQTLLMRDGDIQNRPVTTAVKRSKTKTRTQGYLWPSPWLNHSDTALNKTISFLFYIPVLSNDGTKAKKREYFRSPSWREEWSNRYRSHLLVIQQTKSSFLCSSPGS